MTADLSALLGYGAACVRVAARDKRPLGNAWHTLATTTAEVIDGWLAGGNNLGILLGHGNLIDVEYDDDAGRQLLAAGESTGYSAWLAPCRRWAGGSLAGLSFGSAASPPSRFFRRAGTPADGNTRGSFHRSSAVRP